MDNFTIDPEAKCRVELIKKLDSSQNPFYIGKLQLPGTLDFTYGISFMVFVAESGVEQLQIAPIDPVRRARIRDRGAVISDGKLTIDLHPLQDKNLKTYYVGEVIGLSEMKLNLFSGIFFTVFTSIEGKEQIQITPLRQREVKFSRSFRREDLENLSD